MEMDKKFLEKRLDNLKVLIEMADRQLDNAAKLSTELKKEHLQMSEKLKDMEARYE